ncbi:hypothetical protein EYF80_020353 [Liparis tanakae]|uniref:Uncharacterized protein n=1 Tax=Liparis tanakae TaxID=230148 RepID=A0A4Z2HWT7_9TELE|nr:hypothetical protein EYF80_020353 [Liparis tanakae]
MGWGESGGEAGGPGESLSSLNVLKTRLQLTDMDGGLEEWSLFDRGLGRGPLLKEPAEGVEQKMGFLGQGPRLRSVDSLREVSRKGLAEKPAAPAMFSEFSALDTKGAGRAFLPLGRNTLLGPNTPDVKSSEESRRTARPQATLVFFTLIMKKGFKPNDEQTEQSPSVERELSKAFLRLSGEIQRDSFRLSLPYVFIITGFM